MSLSAVLRPAILPPMHALPQHRPLGSINRIRRVVYKTISSLRRELNNVSLKEPTASSLHSNTSASLTAFFRSCSDPKYRSVVRIDSCPSRN